MRSSLCSIFFPFVSIKYATALLAVEALEDSSATLLRRVDNNKESISSTRFESSHGKKDVSSTMAIINPHGESFVEVESHWPTSYEDSASYEEHYDSIPSSDMNSVSRMAREVESKTAARRIEEKRLTHSATAVGELKQKLNTETDKLSTSVRGLQNDISEGTRVLGNGMRRHIETGEKNANKKEEEKEMEEEVEEEKEGAENGKEGGERDGEGKKEEEVDEKIVDDRMKGNATEKLSFIQKGQIQKGQGRKIDGEDDEKDTEEGSSDDNTQGSKNKEKDSRRSDQMAALASSAENELSSGKKKLMDSGKLYDELSSKARNVSNEASQAISVLTKNNTSSN